MVRMSASTSRGTGIVLRSNLYQQCPGEGETTCRSTRTFFLWPIVKPAHTINYLVVTDDNLTHDEPVSQRTHIVRSQELQLGFLQACSTAASDAQPCKLSSQARVKWRYGPSLFLSPSFKIGGNKFRQRRDLTCGAPRAVDTNEHRRRGS